MSQSAKDLISAFLTDRFAHENHKNMCALTLIQNISQYQAAFHVRALWQRGITLATSPDLSSNKKYSALNYFAKNDISDSKPEYTVGRYMTV